MSLLDEAQLGDVPSHNPFILAIFPAEYTVFHATWTVHIEKCASVQVLVIATGASGYSKDIWIEFEKVHCMASAWMVWTYRVREHPVPRTARH